MSVNATGVAGPDVDETHEMFRAAVRTFMEREVVPHHERWEREGVVDRELFLKAGAAGYLGMDVPERYGGGGVEDFRYNAIFREEAARALVAISATRVSLHNDVCIPYFLSADDEQRQRWLPGLCDGTLVSAIAMTEPTAGSDLASMRTTAERDGDHYVINGAKTMISNGINCDLVIVACKTDPGERHRGVSLIVAEADTPGFQRGRNLKKVGQWSADTAELFFDDMRVPAGNLLGEEGTGFRQLMEKLPRERLSIAVDAVAQAQAAFDLTLTYVKDREAFGRPIGTFQHNRFSMAEMRTEIDIAKVFVDRQIDALNRGELSIETAAEAKWWSTELCKRVVDQCLQLHGGYGYMEEYPIAGAWRDARIMTIYGGTTEIMKEIIGRGLGL
ncbi:MAG TPA: acyl-CoA dehydrogenase family protein [Solirubrobacterales bacterium]|jgi:alkylation response protein AidB-like acyl-CoA dehydrogenase